jgi:hypothetical protein
VRQQLAPAQAGEHELGDVAPGLRAALEEAVEAVARQAGESRVGESADARLTAAADDQDDLADELAGADRGEHALDARGGGRERLESSLQHDEGVVPRLACSQ